MREEIKDYCETFVQNRETVRKVFPWGDGFTCFAGAAILTMNGSQANQKSLKQSKELLNQKVGVFSNFRGTAFVPVAAMMACDISPDKVLDHGMDVYKRLKKQFWGSSYLPFTAMMIAQTTEPDAYDGLVERTRSIYEQMGTKHPFLTSSEDSPLCALLACSSKSDAQLIDDMEQCFKILKKQFFHGNAVQSLAHVLALFEEPAELKCEKTMQLFHGLKEAGKRYGTMYELPTLGVLAMSQAPVKEVVQEMTEIDKWLSKQRGFGFWSGITDKQRLMYAGMLAQKDCVKTQTFQTAAFGGTVAMVLAQEAALCAVVACSMAATAAQADTD